ncbi:MAG: hypothetical protein ACI4TX_01465 [Christensenellales bacterium]
MKLKQKQQSKLVAVLSVMILALVAFSTALTFAWFTDVKNSNYSSISFGNMKINENTFAVSSTDCHTPIVPGCKLALSGKVTLEANVPVLVRLKVNVKVGKMVASEFVELQTADYGSTQEEKTANETAVTNLNEGLADELLAILNGRTAVTVASSWNIATSDTNTNGSWIYFAGVMKDTNDDGTTNIFDFDTKTLQIPTTLNNFFQDKIIQISLEAQTIQAAHSVKVDDNEIGVDEFVTGATFENEKAIIDAIGNVSTTAWNNVQAVA